MGLGLYAFMVSLIHAEILETMFGFPSHRKAERQREALKGDAAEERHLEIMADLKRLMEISAVRGDPRTMKPHWYLRV